MINFLFFQETERKYVIPAMFNEVYSKVKFGNPSWNSLEASDSMLYPWDEKSTYIKSPPFFDNMVSYFHWDKALDKSALFTRTRRLTSFVLKHRFSTLYWSGTIRKLSSGLMNFCSHIFTWVLKITIWVPSGETLAGTNETLVQNHCLWYKWIVEK